MEAPQKIQVNLDEEIKRSYLDYAMSVIIGRALPDVRDGFKPVHRRVLWAMHELGNSWNKPHKKSARVVGEVIGKYHPHGEAAVYETIVRMVQPFSIRYPLIDGQGNFGSVDGDEPAAMRYTEIRLAKIADEVLADIEKNTVDFQPNYDDSLQEPTVLPVRFPNLLVNGGSGIAVGMATNIPPHNLNEVIEATIYLLQNPEATVEDLMRFIPGPDFPTGGFIYGREGIRQAYLTGRGTIIMRARAAIDRIGRGTSQRDAIVVTEIPYQVNKAKLIEKIAELVNERRLEGIADLRDESSREGMRIVIELKRDAVPQVILSKLYKLTPMQETFGVINLAIVNGQPKVLNLVETLQEFINFRREVVRRRTEYELAKAEARAHILEGLKRALNHIDAIVTLIRKSKTGAQAREALMLRFKFSQAQAQAILDMKLERLTGLEREKLVEEYEEIIKKIAELKEILASDRVLRNVIIRELRAVQKEHGDARRTQIVDEEAEIRLEDLIPDEEVVITTTHSGFIKRTPLLTFRQQSRGTRGRYGMIIRGEDFVSKVFVASTHSFVMVFTDKGKVYNIKVHEIPEAQAASRGRAITNLANISTEEKVAGIVAVRDFSPDKYVVMVTRKGIIKKTQLSEFDNLRASGLIAMTVDDDDELISAELTDGKKKIFIATHQGMAICFDESDVRPMGRQARGVRGIDLRDGDYVVSVSAVTGDEQMLSITERGFGKQTPLSEYRIQSRGGRGVINVKTTERNGRVVAVMPVKEDDEVMIITSQGKLLRIEASEIRETGRSAQGVRLIKLAEDDFVASASLVGREDDQADTAQKG
ncbi:MAG TPA: DNA gyrase subunit A [Blastocatellia bacterium]|nr:DNA gyrase subunit A [Blastocatellia bacterium]